MPRERRPDFDAQSRAETIAEVLWDTVSDITHGNYDAGTFRVRGDGWIAVLAAALAAAYRQGRDENGVTLARDALNDESLSDLSARAAAREILAPTPVTADDIAWAESVLRPSRTEEA